MEKNYWEFPYGKGLSPRGINHPSIETFLDNISNSLAREIIQNSLDAAVEFGKKSVRIEFSRYEIAIKDIPGIDYIKNEVLKKASEFDKWVNNEDTQDYLEKFKNLLEGKKVTVLKISDYNTKGLTQKNYDTLIHGEGFSEKDSVDSAGSKGIGKAAPFAASDLRMVFYNSYNEDNENKSAGVLNFVSYFENKDENEITQGQGIIENCFDISTKEGLLNLQNIDPNPRMEEKGTDLYIIGLKNFDDWKEKICLSVLDNFLLTLFNQQIDVVVMNEIIDYITIEDVLSKLSNNKKMNKDIKSKLLKIENYFNLLKEDNPKIYLDEDFVKKYDFIDSIEDAFLTLNESENANRCILETRLAGMKIQERNRISKSINFNGIFHAKGKKLNRFLKDIENANHDNWSNDRISSKNKGNNHNKFLGDLLKFYKKNVEEKFGVPSDDVIDAFEMDKFLPSDGNKNTAEVKEKPKLDKKIKEVKKKKNKKTTTNLPDGENADVIIDKILEEIGVEEGNETGSGSDREGGTGGNSPGNNYGIGEEGGGSKENPESEEKTKSYKEKELTLGKDKDIFVKVVETDYKNGEYNVILEPNKNFKEIVLEFKVVGGTGEAFSQTVNNALLNDSKLKISKSRVHINNLIKNEMSIVNLTINFKERIKMEVLINEIK